MPVVEVDLGVYPGYRDETFSPVDHILGSLSKSSTKEKFWGEGKWRDGASFDDGSAQYWGEVHTWGTMYEKIQVRHGSGLCIWNTGDMYLGQHDRDLREGKGVCIYHDGMMYDGMWKEGLRHGYGRCLYPSGAVYMGQWENDSREGVGVYKWPDGTVYMGSWTYDRRHGHATIVFANQNFFEGQIQSNMKHGLGRYVWGPDSCYIGGFCRDEISGLGAYFHEGERYDGHFVNPGRLKRPTFLELKEGDREKVISEDILARSKTVMDKKVSRMITRSMKRQNSQNQGFQAGTPGSSKLSNSNTYTPNALKNLGMMGSTDSLFNSSTPRFGDKPRIPLSLPKLPVGEHSIMGGVGLGNGRAIRSDSWFLEETRRDSGAESVCFRMVFDEDWLKVKDRSVKLQSSSQNLSRVSLPKGRTPSPHMFPVTLERSHQSPSPFNMRVELITTSSPSSVQPTHRDLPPVFDGKSSGFPMPHRPGEELSFSETEKAINGGTHIGDLARKALEKARSVVNDVNKFVKHTGLVPEMEDNSTDPKYIIETLKAAAEEKIDMARRGAGRRRATQS